MNRFDPLDIASLVERADRRWREFEAVDLVAALDRQKLSSFHREVADLVDTVNIQIVSEIKMTSQVLGDNLLESFIILDANGITRELEKHQQAFQAKDELKSTECAFRISVSFLLAVMLQLRTSLPSKATSSSDGAIGNGGDYSESLEHPYTIRNLRGTWERMRVSLVDYMSVRQAVYKARNLPVVVGSPRLVVEKDELLQQLRRAYWTENIFCHSIATALVRQAILVRFDVVNTVSISEIKQITTPQLVNALTQLGFHPFHNTNVYAGMIEEAELCITAGVLPLNVDQYTLVLLTEQYILGLNDEELDGLSNQLCIKIQDCNQHD